MALEKSNFKIQMWHSEHSAGENEMTWRHSLLHSSGTFVHVKLSRQVLVGGWSVVFSYPRRQMYLTVVLTA